MTTPTTDSPARIRRIYDGYAGLYADSLVTDAAALLDAYLATAEQHGQDRKAADEEGWLALAAAEAVSKKHSRPKTERVASELHELLAHVRTALTAEGLTVVSTPVRMGVAVAPVPGGPVWGTGPGGLAVALYSDSGWQLSTNSTRSTVHSIYAPVTEAGAAEVAQLVHGVLRGDVADPFRRNR
ncbi:hypothetical protein [Streptomyces lunaelactis]|nr:hypothetical protein [Streptomyces lunaelactis]NUK84939.1 hypothetical protein [Streptomyces lunaelactis]